MDFSKNIFLSIALLVGFASPVWAGEPISWKLQSAAQVDGSGIFLEEIVALNSPTALPRTRLAASPEFGKTISFSRAKVIEMAKEMNIELSATNCSGAAQVVVSRRNRSLDSGELIRLLTASLKKDYVQERGELELSLSRTWLSALVPDEPLTLKITDLPASGISPNFTVRFELWAGKTHFGDFQMPVQCHVWREIPIAHTTATRGELLADADLTLERRDILMQRDAFLGDPLADPSLELVETIRAGMPVLNRSVKVRPLIRRGKLVDAVFQDGALSISLKVQALEDGTLGQVVRVRNPKSKRELSGKVQNETTILISL
jgi:flagella basal body P-ring formation protein FlgA